MRRTTRTLVTIILFGASLSGAFGQDTDDKTASAQDAEHATVAAQMADMLTRAASGHSPTTEEIHTVEGLPATTRVDVAKELTPLMAKALANPDAAVRGYGLAMLVGMQATPPAAPSADNPTQPGGNAPTTAPTGVKNSSLTVEVVPACYKGDVGKVLVPLIPAIVQELSDDDPENRKMAADALAGFTPNTPAAVYSALSGFLKRDDAVGAVGTEVVQDLLHLGPLSDEIATSIAKFLHRNDQTPEAEANLVEAIASESYQNRLVDQAVLSYLDADDPGLRARVLLSLPRLDLSPEAFADFRAKVDLIVSGGQENLQVVNAAKAVAGCWTQIKMTTGCPVY